MVDTQLDAAETDTHHPKPNQEFVLGNNYFGLGISTDKTQASKQVLEVAVSS